MKKFIALLIIFVMVPGIFSQKVNAWKTSNPDDLNIIRNSVWSFQYNNHIDNVAFSDEYAFDANNVVNLLAVNMDNPTLTGIVQYGNMPDSNGIGFICAMSDISHPVTDAQFYMFNAVGGVASGQYCYFSTLAPENTTLYPLSGYKILDLSKDPNQVTTPAENTPIKKNKKSDDSFIGGCFIYSLAP